MAEALLARDVACFAVESSPTLPTSMKSRYNPGSFDQVIRHAGNLDQTLSAVQRRRPTHLIAGFESGVELAEWLAQRLDLPTNDAHLRAARRDKFLMSEAARAHGVRTPLQYQSRHIDQLLEWTRATLDWPVIVKPPKSVASDHVQCCRTIDQVRDAAESILDRVNLLGLRNKAVIVQEFLEGVEYAVDTVSCGGQHRLTAIWQYHRPVGSREFVSYDAMQLVPYQGRRQEALWSCVADVLPAVGIRFGPAHCELMWVNNGPVLIEIGARMSAGNNAVLSRICGGICQLDETVRAILAPHEFIGPNDQPPRLEQHAANVFLVPPQRGILVGTRHLDRLQSLPTLHSLSVATQPGEMLKHVAGRVTLVHPDPLAIERDIAAIRTLERDGIFQVQPAPPTPSATQQPVRQ